VAGGLACCAAAAGTKRQLCVGDVCCESLCSVTCGACHTLSCCVYTALLSGCRVPFVRVLWQAEGSFVVGRLLVFQLCYRQLQPQHTSQRHSHTQLFSGDEASCQPHGLHTHDLQSCSRPQPGLPDLSRHTYAAATSKQRLCQRWTCAPIPPAPLLLLVLVCAKSDSPSPPLNQPARHRLAASTAVTVSLVRGGVAA
jgi:hypothetical protein